jgi:hypothetical protein
MSKRDRLRIYKRWTLLDFHNGWEKCLIKIALKGDVQFLEVRKDKKALQKLCFAGLKTLTH